MNRNLTQRSLAQLGEIDLVPMAMESNDCGTLMPMPEDVKPRVAIPDTRRDQSPFEPALPDGEMHANPEPGPSDPLPYVWSM
ncbi:MAG: hypothetical protein WBM09_12510 [Gallionella sp.]